MKFHIHYANSWLLEGADVSAADILRFEFFNQVSINPSISTTDVPEIPQICYKSDLFMYEQQNVTQAVF